MGIDEAYETCRPNDVSMCCTKPVGLTTCAKLSFMNGGESSPSAWSWQCLGEREDEEGEWKGTEEKRSMMETNLEHMVHKIGLTVIQSDTCLRRLLCRVEGEWAGER